jgi:hypothetical protein
MDRFGSAVFVSLRVLLCSKFTRISYYYNYCTRYKFKYIQYYFSRKIKRMTIFIINNDARG